MELDFEELKATAESLGFIIGDLIAEIDNEYYYKCSLLNSNLLHTLKVKVIEESDDVESIVKEINTQIDIQVKTSKKS